MLQRLQGHKRIGHRHLLLTVTILWAVLSGAARTAAAQDTAASSDPAVQRLNDSVYRHEMARTLAAVFETARDDLNSGQTIRGLERLQQILDQPFDTFVNLSGNPRPSSLRGQIAQLFNQLPRQTLDAYERRFGGDAQQELERIEQQGSAARFRTIVRRFPYTRAGFTALDRLATDYLDREHFVLAAHCWLRLVTQPAYGRFLTTHTLVKSQLAFEAAGWDEPAAAVLQLVQGREVDIAGQPVQAETWLSERRMQQSVEPPPTWSPFGNSAHNAVVDATVPWQAPEWLHPFLPEEHGEAYTELQTWLLDQQGQPQSVANFAVAVDGQVIVREADGLRSVDAADGRIRWTYPLHSSYLGAFDHVKDELGGNDLARRMGKPFVDPGLAYVTNSVLGTLSADGQRLYFVDAGRLRRPRFPTSDDGRTTETNQLTALDLHELDANGHPRVLWTLGQPAGDDSGSDPPAPAATGNGANEPRLLFLGAPACIGGVLYATVERDRQLSVMAIEPFSGEVLWSQGLGFVRRAADYDSSRAVLTCTPARARGTLICPTHESLLVGVDAVDGTLRWSYFHGDVPHDFVPASQRAPIRESFGHPGFPSTPVVEGQRIVYLPRHSRWIHCVDASSGSLLWKVPRSNPHLTGYMENGDEYIGAIHSGIVLIVGQRNCRGLSLADGREVWSHYYGMPSGRGLLTGDTYLLPLESGRVAQLDVATGREIGIAVPQHVLRSHARLLGLQATGDQRLSGGGPGTTEPAPRLPRDWFPGNLLAVGDRIVSVGVEHIVAFEQAGSRLHTVTAQLQRDGVRETGLGLALVGSALGGSVPLSGGLAMGAARTRREAMLHAVEAAALELSLGRVDEAYARLERVYRRNPDAPARVVVEDLMRDVLHLQIDLTGDPDGSKLALLEELSRSPRHRAAYLFRAGNHSLQHEQVAELLEAGTEMDTLTLAEPLPHPGDPTHLQTGHNWRAGMLQSAARTFHGDALSQLEQEVQRLRLQTLEESDMQSMEWFLQSFPQFDDAARVRCRLAELYERQGRLQHSELVLLDGSHSADPEIAVLSKRALVDFWQRCGLYEEAAGLLAKLERQSVPADDPGVPPAHAGTSETVSSDADVGDVASAKSTASVEPTGDTLALSPTIRMANGADGQSEFARAAWERLQLPDYRLRTVSVSQDDWTENDPLTLDAYRAFRSKQFPLPIDNSFVILDKGTDQEPELTFINRYLGRIQNRIPVSPMTQTSLVQIGASVGHFFTAWSKTDGATRVAGMSLLNGLSRPRNQPLWERSFGPDSEESDVGLGPVGARYSVLQVDDRIIAIDSSNGAKLWERRKQPISSGVLNDPHGGMLGDDRVLVVFEHDRETYSSYEMSTGELLGKGQIESFRRLRFGRRLFFESRVDDRKLFHLWDPLLESGEYVWTVPAHEPVAGRVFCVPVENQPECVAFIAEGGELVVYDVFADEYRLRAPMQGVDWQELIGMEVFTDGQHYFTSLRYRDSLRLGHLRRRSRARSGELAVNPLRPGFLPGTKVEGSLAAFEIATGRQLWSQEMPASTVLHLTGIRLPFLICASRLAYASRDQYLSVSCLDAATGELLGENSGLKYDNLMHYEYDPQKRHLALQGVYSRIGLRFHQALQRL